MPGTLADSYLELGAYSSAVPCARLHTRNILAEWGIRPIADTVELIVSELVTNAVEASADSTEPYVSLRLAAEAGFVRIDVWDASPHLPEPQPHALDSDSGRGFEIVSMLASSIGVIPDPYGNGKTIWALVAYE
jgi:anti-sigma regulatory factor (Ser/Thr protein kinase)